MKKTLHFSIDINAPKENVWNAMLGDETYRIWASAFAEGSQYKGSWEKGSSIHFVVPNGDGMASEIAENIPYSFISVRHIGFMVNGVADTENEAIKAWLPAYENYTFTEENGVTTVNIDLDVTEDFEKDMADMWPKALEKLKEICE